MPLDCAEVPRVLCQPGRKQGRVACRPRHPRLVLLRGGRRQEAGHEAQVTEYQLTQVLGGGGLHEPVVASCDRRGRLDRLGAGWRGGGRGWHASQRGSQDPRRCGPAHQKKELAAFHVLVNCPTLRFSVGGVGRCQDPQFQTVPALPAGCGDDLVEGEADRRCQPAQGVRMGNAAPLVAEDGLAGHPAVDALLLGRGVHPSGDTIQREALSLASPRDECCERKTFHSVAQVPQSWCRRRSSRSL